MTANPQQEKTLVLIKPDGVKRGLIGEIIKRIEQRGLKVIALRIVEVSKKQIDGHYPKDKKWIERLGKKTLVIYEKYNVSAQEKLGTDNESEIGGMVRLWLLDYMSSGPIVKMVVQGIHAIDMVRKLCGNTLPNLAEMGTIRGDYSVDSPTAANSAKRAIHNIIHASENPEEANHEISYWFSPEDVHEYKRAEEDIMF